MPLDLEVALQTALLPLLQVAYHAEPRAMTCRLEHELIVGRIGRLHEEDLYQGTRLLAEMQTRLNHPGVVVNHQSALGQILRQTVEYILAYLTMTVEKKFGVVALRQGELGNALIRKGVIVIGNFYMFCIHYD